MGLDTLQTLVELEALRVLKASYFRYMDTKDWAAWTELFTPQFEHEWMESSTRSAIISSPWRRFRCGNGHMATVESTPSATTQRYLVVCRRLWPSLAAPPNVPTGGLRPLPKPMKSGGLANSTSGSPGCARFLAGTSNVDVILTEDQRLQDPTRRYPRTANISALRHWR
jgi:hypothetical protein